MFSPSISQKITINNIKYTFQEHPASPGIPFGASGKRATVYQLSDGEKKFALKVFIPQFREPRMVSVAEKLSVYAGFPGLSAANRIVLTGSKHIELLKQEKELSYTVLMPWINGFTWGNYCLSKMPFSPEQSLNFSRAFTKILLNMEENGLAHCDLSSSNFILQGTSDIELIDLEEMYGPDFLKPDQLPAGSPGYAHKTAQYGLWSAQADRFTGAVLIAEMLGWRSEKVRETAWDESYFKPDEMQTDCERYQILQNELLNQWGKSVSDLFAQAWFSDSLRDCPTFSDWMIVLPDEVPALKKNITNPEKETILIDASSETLPSDTWTCPECGVTVLEKLDICPKCERGQKPVSLRSPIKQDWFCSTCSKSVSGNLKVCPYCEGREITPIPIHRLKLWAGGIFTICVIIFFLILNSGKIISPPIPIEDTATITPSKTSTITLTPKPTLTFTPSPTNTITPLPTMTFTPTIEPGTIKISPIDGMEMVYIPAGEFIFWDHNWNKEPSLFSYQDYTNSFWIDKHEVTNNQYFHCLNAGVCNDPDEVFIGYRTIIATRPSNYYNWSTPREITIQDYLAYYNYFKGYENHPIYKISFEDAMKYCEWVGRRLPSEIEWQKAARGTDGRKFPWGNEFITGAANVGWTGKPEVVGAFPMDTSPYGVLDMAGNVGEYTTSERWHFYNGGDYLTAGENGLIQAMILGESFHDMGFRCVSDN